MSKDLEVTVNLLQNELVLLKEENRRLQKQLGLTDIELKYEAINTQSNDEEKAEFVNRLLMITADLFNNHLYSDVLILLEGGRQLNGHKLILSARSDNWGIIYTDFGKDDSLNLTDIRYEVALAAMKWVYTSKISTNLDDIFILELLQVAKRFKLKSLQNRCEKNLISCVNAGSSEKRKRKNKSKKKKIEDSTFVYDKFLRCSELGENSVQCVEDNMVMQNNVTSTISKTINDNEKKIIDKKQHQCDSCGKLFSSKNTLQKHIRLHSGIKPYECEICHKQFSNNGNLKQHRRIHSGEKPYVCDFCGKSFNGNNDLHKHIRIHTGEKPFVCEMCGKAFCQNNTLQVHMRSHTGEKPHSCTVCSKSFSSTSTLRCHMLIHTGQKPYNCDICGKSFRKRFHVQKHTKTHFKYQTF